MMSDRIPIRVILGLVLVLGCAAAASASTEGRISGIVRDATTGLPIPNANVVVLNTTRGAASMSAGEFFILNVPAGTYSVQASVIGYRPLIVENIVVAPDFTTDVQFSLEPTVVAILDPVRVAAERPLIQRDATATVRILDATQYGKLPTRGYQDAASLQAGVVGSQGASTFGIQGNETTNSPLLFIRGGRANEVAYFVDGFSQQDPLTGYSTTSINTNAVDQVVVMTGGFNAEYGRIMSGAVNVVTKEGSPRYFGTFEAVTDNLAGGWVGAKRYDYNVYAGSLGGPLLPGNDKVTFFASGERRWQEDRAPRSQAAGILPSNSLSGLTWQGKVAWRLSPAVTLKGGTLGSADDWQEYLHQYSLIPDNMPRYEDRNNSYFGTLTHNVNRDTYYNVSVNWFETSRVRGDGVHFDDLAGYGRVRVTQITPDSSVTEILGNRVFDKYALYWAAPSASHPGRVWDDFMKRSSSYTGLQGDVTRKWSEHNVAKFGGDFQRHTLRYYQHLFPAEAIRGEAGDGYKDVVNFGYDVTGTRETEGKEGRFDDGAKHPITASAFIQNKYEYADFVVNAGIRYDHLDPRTASLASADRPFGPRTGDVVLDPEDLLSSKGQDKISPRLGIGFPVSDRTLFHANYGKFFQQPNLQDLYTSYRYLEYKVATGGYYFAFGNPNLVPETTTAYEVGLTHAVGPRVRADATAFYKDVRDLVQVQNVPSSPRAFASYRNTDFGTIKGLDFSIQMQETSGISGSATYSLSYANGTGSISDSQRDIAWTAAETPKQTAPLSFDQRHKFVFNVDISSGPEDGPEVFGFRPFERAGLNVLFNASSGFPYTPIYPENEITLAAISSTPSGPVNSRYGPWNYQVDAKMTRGFRASNLDLEAYVWVLNLFDTINEITVYSSSGSAFTTGWLSTEPGRQWASDNGAAGISAYRHKELNPNNFGIPRMVRFGLKTSF